MLRRIALTNFKSFRSASLEFGALTLIVGANASGKSNIRDALRFLHGVGLGYSCAEILGDRYGPGGIQQWRGIRGGPREVAFAGAERFALEVAIAPGRDDSLAGTLEYRVEVDVSNERLGPRCVAERLLQGRGRVMVFDSAPSDDPVDQHGDHELRVRQPRGENYRKHGRVSAFPSATPSLSQFPHHPDEPRTVRVWSEMALEVLGSIRFLDLDPEAMRVASPPGVVVLGDRGENLSSVLHSICTDESRKQSLLAWVRGLTPMDAVDFEFRADLSGKLLVYLVESNGAAVSAVSASDGTLRFLALVAALLSKDSGRTYFFEEFDNGIHPTRLHLLLELVQKACREQAVQVIGTTHNPALLAFLDQEARNHAVLAYRNEGEAESRLRRIAELPEIQRILDTQDLGRLHASGWLEDAAVFSEPEQEPAA